MAVSPGPGRCAARADLFFTRATFAAAFGLDFVGMLLRLGVRRCAGLRPPELQS
jgi:hypothetical protein